MSREKLSNVQSNVGEKRVMHECEGRGRTLDVQENGREGITEQHDSQERGSVWSGGTSDNGKYDGPKQTGS